MFYNIFERYLTLHYFYISHFCSPGCRRHVSLLEMVPIRGVPRLSAVMIRDLAPNTHNGIFYVCRNSSISNVTLNVKMSIDKGLFPYYIISYNKQGSFQMIIEDYNKGPRVVRKDYVLQKIKNLQESASMPASSGQSQFSIRSLVALKLKLKNYVCGQSPIDFENILEETYLPISTYIYISFLPKQTLFQHCS